MSGIRAVALGAALFAATAGAVSAQATQGTPRGDSATKAGEWRKDGPRGPRGRGFGPGMQGRPGMPGMDFMRGLNLTETQRTQVRAIHEKYQPQMQSLHKRAKTDFESQASTLHEQMFREVRTVLTAEQRAKIDAQLAERIKKLDEDKARLERLRR